MLMTFKTIHQIADDTNVFVRGKSLDDVIAIANNSLASLSKWFAANKLSLSVYKTSYSVFWKPDDKKHNFTLQLCNNDIKQVSSCKYLG